MMVMMMTMMMIIMIMMTVTAMLLVRAVGIIVGMVAVSSAEAQDVWV